MTKNLDTRTIVLKGKNMLKRLLILISIFAWSQLFAADVLLKIGANNSWFANEGGTSETTPAIGVGVQFPIHKSQNIKLGADAMYVGQKMNLLNKSWPDGPSSDHGATIGDLYLYYHYLKMPLYIGTILYRSNDILVNCSIGVGMSLLITSSSDGGNYRYEVNHYDYDYRRTSERDQPRFQREIIAGVGFVYKSLGLDALYSYTFDKTKYLRGLTIRDNILSFRLMLTWRINKSSEH